MHCRAYALRSQGCGHLIPLWHTDREKMPNGGRPGRDLLQGNTIVAFKDFSVSSGQLSPSVICCLQVPELDSQHGRVQLLEARVLAHEGVMIAIPHPVVAQQAHALGPVRIIRHNRPGIAQRTEVLGGIET